MPKRDAIDEHKRLVAVLSRGDRKDLDRERADQQKELDEMTGSGNTIRRMLGRNPQVAPAPPPTLPVPTAEGRRQAQGSRSARRSSESNRRMGRRVRAELVAEDRRRRRESDPRDVAEDERRLLEQRAFADLSPHTPRRLHDNLRTMIDRTSLAELRSLYG